MAVGQVTVQPSTKGRRYLRWAVCNVVLGLLLSYPLLLLLIVGLTAPAFILGEYLTAG